MKKIIMIGKTGCGKTTLCQKLHGETVEYKKTQAVDTYTNAIDTPGEYIENRFFYNAAINVAADAEVIGLVHDCTVSTNFFPPSFGAIFPKPVIGIVTKIDLAQNDSEVQLAEEYLRMAGAEKIFKISATDGDGINEIYEYLEIR